MKLAALLTILALAPSSIVAAETEVVPTTTTLASTSWVALSAPMPLSRGRDVIRLDDQAGVFTRLRFQRTQGSSHIEQVIVKFVDGTSQTIDLAVKLDAVTPTVQFDLAVAGRIDRLIVIGASSRRSSVQLLGS